MKKYLNLVLDIPIVALCSWLLYNNWNLYSGIGVIICIATLLVKTSNEEYTPVQLLPVYLFWTTISCMLIWTPSILLNKNAEVIALQNVIDKVAANVHTELIPLVIAAAIGILSAVISMIVGKKCLGDILKIIVCNAFCIAIVLTIHKNVFINKFANVVCILSLLYALLFEEKHRIKNSSLYWIIISLNCFGLFLYNIGSNYIEYSVATNLPQISSFCSGWLFFGILCLIGVFLILTAKKPAPIKRTTTNHKADFYDVMQGSAVTILCLIFILKFTSIICSNDLVSFASVLILLGLNIFARSYKSGKMLVNGEYIVSYLIYVLLAILLISFSIGQPEMVSYIFGNYIVYGIVAVVFVAAWIALGFNEALGLILFGITVLIASISYSFDLINILLIIGLTAIGFFLVVMEDEDKVFLMLFLLIFALIPNYLSVSGVKTSIYSDGEVVCGDLTKENSLLCIQQRQGLVKVDEMVISWDDGTTETIKGFTTAYTRIKPGEMTVTTKNVLGREMKQKYSFDVDGRWEASLENINTLEAATLDLVEFSMTEKETKTGEKNIILKKEKVLSNEETILVSEQKIGVFAPINRNMNVIAYIILDSEENVVKKGYIEDSNYIEIQFPQSNGEYILKCYSIDEAYNVTPFNSWNISYSKPEVNEETTNKD